jgi:hypothetical protein
MCFMRIREGEGVTMPIRFAARKGRAAHDSPSKTGQALIFFSERKRNPSSGFVFMVRNRGVAETRSGRSAAVLPERRLRNSSAISAGVLEKEAER